MGALREANPRIERAALLVPKEAVALRRQLEHLLGEAHHPNRLLCLDATRVQSWLFPVLTEAERARLRLFLASLGVA